MCALNDFQKKINVERGQIFRTLIIAILKILIFDFRLCTLLLFSVLHMLSARTIFRVSVFFFVSCAIGSVLISVNY